jgi:hypothetical protein
MTTDQSLADLRRRRDTAAMAGDHGEALVLNDRIHALKSMVACPACCSVSGTPRDNHCIYCGNEREVTEERAAAYGPW